MDDRQPLELLHPAPQRSQPEDVGDEVDRHRLIADPLKDLTEPAVLLVGDRKKDDVDRLTVQKSAELVVAPEPLHVLSDFLLGVVDHAQHLDPHVGPPAQPANHLRRGPSAPHHHGVPEVVPPSPGEPERLPKDGSGDTHGDDGEDPEVEDHEPGVVVAPEEERHDRDQHHNAQGRGLGDIHPLREV